VCYSNNIKHRSQTVCHSQKASQEEGNKGDHVLHYSFTHPCQTTSQCLPENFLPYWTDPQQITEDPVPRQRCDKLIKPLSKGGSKTD